MDAIIPSRYIKAFVLLGAIVVFLNSPAQSSTLRILNDREDAPESCHLRELELCSMGFMSIFQNPNGLPVKEAELKRQCEYFDESVKCLEKYSRNCLSDRITSLVDMFTQNPTALVNEFCRADSGLRVNYTKHVECYREVQRKFQKDCMTDFQAGLESIHKLNASLRIATGCCNLNRMKECIFGPINYECGIEASETVERLLMSISGTWFTLPCRTYDSGHPECQKLLPPPGTKPHTGRNTSALSRVVSSFTTVREQL